MMNYTHDYPGENADARLDDSSPVARTQQGISYTPPSGPPPSYQEERSSAQLNCLGNSSYQSQAGYYVQGNGKSPSYTAEHYPPQPQYPTPSTPLPQVQPPDTSHSLPSGSTAGLKSSFMGHTASDIFDSPPPGFTRPPPHNPLMSAPFPSFAHISAESNLEKGFPSLIPSSPCQPHPFVIHDVRQEDWERLLSDIKVVSKLSGMDKVISNVAPMVMGVGFLGGMFVTSAMEKGMKKKKVVVVSDIVDHWNHYFFHPRWMEVTLVQGHVVHAGASGSPADILDNGGSSHGQYNAALRHPDHDSSFGDHEMGRFGRRAGGRRSGIRQDRRERIEAMRERRVEDKETSKEKWRLVVSFRPPQSM